jgi:hypothetical protein
MECPSENVETEIRRLTLNTGQKPAIPGVLPGDFA